MCLAGILPKRMYFVNRKRQHPGKKTGEYQCSLDMSHCLRSHPELCHAIYGENVAKVRMHTNKITEAQTQEHFDIGIRNVFG